MTTIEILVLALALAADAFAAAVASGAAVNHPRVCDAAATALYFGIAEGLMVCAGFLAGGAARGLIEHLDHWIAFALLGLIGSKMVREGLSGDGEARAEPETGDPPAAPRRDRGSVVARIVTAAGTSIDSAIVGVTLALIGVRLLFAAPVIGATSFLVSFIGVMLGRKLGPILGRRAEIVGGIVLIAIGTRILVDHLSAAR